MVKKVKKVAPTHWRNNANFGSFGLQKTLIINIFQKSKICHPKILGGATFVMKSGS
jgi:hypothetical protein